MTDPAASTLAGIRDDNLDSYADGSTSDIPRLVAAVEVALSYHRPLDRQEVVGTSRRCGTCAGLPYWPCAQYKAITAELTGTGRAQPGEDGNHG